SEAQQDAFLIACGNGDRLAAGDGSWQAQRPLTLAGDGLPRVVDEDQLLLDHLAGLEVVVLAREAARLAAEVGQQRAIVADERLRRGRRHPVRPLQVGTHLPLLSLSVVRTEARLLEVLPVHLEILASPLHALAQFPEGLVFPRRVRGQPPGAMGAPVVGDVPGENLLPLIEVSGSHGVRVIPAMPEIAGAELPGLPAEVLLLPLADSEGLIAEELGIPLGEAKLPRHSGAAEGPLPLVPATVHCPVPGEGYAVLAQEDRFHSPGCPVLEPVGHLLD